MLVLRSFYLEGEELLQPIVPSALEITPPGALLLLTSGRADSRVVMQETFLRFSHAELGKVRMIFLFLRYIPGETFHQRLVVTPSAHSLGPDDLSQLRLLNTRTLNVAAQEQIKELLGTRQLSIDQYLDAHPEAFSQLVNGPLTPHVGAVVWSTRRHQHPSKLPIPVAAIFDADAVSHAAYTQAKEKESEILGVSEQDGHLVLTPYQPEKGASRGTAGQKRSAPKAGKADAARPKAKKAEGVRP